MGLKPILRTTTSFSALTLSVGSFDAQKPVPDMTYNGTVNPTQSINQTFGMNSPNNRLLSDAGLVCIPDVTKVTLTSMRL